MQLIVQAFGGAIALSDQALRATKMIARLSHPVVDMQGKKAMKSMCISLVGLG